MTTRSKESILKKWALTESELTEIINENPSMRGLMLGYIAEYKLRKMFFSDPKFTNVPKDDDHDRSRKGDLRITFKSREFKIECKSLQTNSVRKVGNVFHGKYQCDASDRRKVTFSDGSTIETTCLLVGEFDVIAVNLFSFGERWRFAFALNHDLPRSRYPKYSDLQKNELLSSIMPITWPLSDPYVGDPTILFDRLINASLSK